jgi:hypothetical protein
VSFERGVRLHLRDVVAFDDDVRIFEALFCFSAAMDRRAVDIAGLRHITGTSSAAGASFFVRRARKHFGSIRGARFERIDHERVRVIANFDQRGCFFRDSRANGGDGRNGLAGIADHRIFHRIQRRIAQHSVAQNVLDDMHAAHAGELLRVGRIDRKDLRVGH